jgi:hypothetical protein
MQEELIKHEIEDGITNGLLDLRQALIFEPLSLLDTVTTMSTVTSQVPQMRQVLKSFVQDCAKQCIDREEYVIAIKFSELCTHLADVPLFGNLHEDAAVLTSLSFDGAGWSDEKREGICATLLDQLSKLTIKTNSSCSMSSSQRQSYDRAIAKVKVVAASPVLCFVENIMQRNILILLPTCTTPLGVVPKSVECSLPGNSYRFRGVPLPLSSWFVCRQTGLRVRLWAKCKGSSPCGSFADDNFVEPIRLPSCFWWWITTARSITD